MTIMLILVLVMMMLMKKMMMRMVRATMFNCGDAPGCLGCDGAGEPADFADDDADP